MVDIPHGTNQVGVGPPNSEIRWCKWDPKWAPMGKMVKSILISVKLCTMTYTKVPETYGTVGIGSRNLSLEAFFEILFWGISQPPIAQFC